MNNDNPCTSFLFLESPSEVEVRWQSEKQSLCVRNAGMNRQNGWGNAPAADNGIK